MEDLSVNLSELKLTVKLLVLHCPNGTTLLSELKKLYKKEEGRELEIVVGKFGFGTVSEMIKSWPEFSVSGDGANLKVKVHTTDHISELNKRSKKSGNKNRFQGWQDRDENRRPFTGKDPYAFSSDDTSDKSLSSWDNVKLQKLLMPMTPTGPKLVKTINKIIPACVKIENFDCPFTVQMLEAINPQRFWFARYAEVKELNVLMKQMNEFYEKAELKIEEQDLRPGLYVAVSFSNIWHRGMILKVFPRGMVRIFYVDFGTVEDVMANAKVRYITEDFIALPATAQRGVLSHVEPFHKVWSEDAIQFFKTAMDKKKFEVKVYKQNSKDSSFSVAIRTSDKQLLSNVLIEKGFCVVDSDFLDKPLSTIQLEFAEYEAGKHLKTPAVEEDNWLPSPSVGKAANSLTKPPFLLPTPVVSKPENWLPTQVVQKVSSPKRQPSIKANSIKTDSMSSANSQFKISPSNPLSFKTSSVEFRKVESPKVLQPRRFRLDYKPRLNSPLAQPAPSSTVPAKTFVAEQSLSKFEVESIKKIYVHVVNGVDQFYFYLKDEFLEICKYLKKFNTAYENNKTINEDFTIGNDVVVIADDNFCRGCIIEDLQNSLFKMFLIDFGIVVERPKTEILALSDEWKLSPPAVYSGKLANVPEHIHLKDRAQLLEIVSNKFIRVKFSRINKNNLEIRLLDP